jgi:hypothetical protein
MLIILLISDLFISQINYLYTHQGGPTNSTLRLHYT